MKCDEQETLSEAGRNADMLVIARKMIELSPDHPRALYLQAVLAARAGNYRFHHRMFAVARQPQTLHFVQILWARYPFDLINRLAGRVSRAAEEHDQMLAAMIAGDSAAAMLATRQHIEAGWLELRDSVTSLGESNTP